VTLAQRSIADRYCLILYRAKCERAAKNANAMSSNYGDIWERYVTQLQIECFDAGEIRQIVGIGKRLQGEGKKPWEIRV
jgi:hypothetical protein